MPSITRPGPASAICRSRSTSCCHETSVGEELVLPVSWQTAHASFLGREAARCRLAHNLINRSGGGAPPPSANQLVVRKKRKENSPGAIAEANPTPAKNKPPQRLGHLHRAESGVAY